MTQTITGSFPQAAGFGYGRGADKFVPAVLVDQPTLANPGRTTGARTAISLPIEPPLAPQPPWTITAYAIECDICLATTNSSFPQSPAVAWLANSPFGRLGKILAGITNNTSAPQPDVTLPADLSLISPIWDGATDPTPPILSGWTPTHPLQTSNMFPQNLTLPQGDQLCIGLWITPSVVNAICPVILNARYTIKYDGQQ